MPSNLKIKSASLRPAHPSVILSHPEQSKGPAFPCHRAYHPPPVDNHIQPLLPFAPSKNAISIRNQTSPSPNPHALHPPRKLNDRKLQSMVLIRTVPFFFLLPIAPLVAQSPSIQQQSMVVLESRIDTPCDPFTKQCTRAQHLVAQVGDRKLELMRYESKPEALLQLGTYPAQKLPSKPTPSYRLNDSYLLTYPDGQTEKFDVVGLLK
jgi:hypothetical protein